MHEITISQRKTIESGKTGPSPFAFESICTFMYCEAIKPPRLSRCKSKQFLTLFNKRVKQPCGCFGDGEVEA